MSDKTEHEVTGFVHFKTIAIRRPMGTQSHQRGAGIVIEGEYRTRRNAAKPNGKVSLHYNPVHFDKRGAVQTTSSAKSIPHYTLLALQESVAYLASTLRSRFNDFSSEEQGIGVLSPKFEVGFVINELFELRTSVSPRKISGSKPSDVPSGDHDDERWAIE